MYKNLAKEAVLTLDNVAKRGISLCNRCSLCGKANETVRHLFLHCNFTGQLQQTFLNLRDISWCLPSKIDETLFGREMAGVRATNRERWWTIPASIWWTIWRERNERCFENRNNNLQEVSLSVFCCSAFGVQMSTPMKLSQSQMLQDLFRFCSVLWIDYTSFLLL